MALKVRAPSGAVPWPLVLVEGPEKSGKSWVAAQLSSSPRVGQTYWIDLGEGAADEYGAIPGARYLIVEHDGTWASLIQAVDDVRAEAQKAADEQAPPVVLVIDSLSAEWELLKTWATERAKGSRRNKELLRKDPNAVVDVTMNYWNDATSRHRQLMARLMTFPGIVVVTARGGEVAAVEGGKPVEGQKSYRVEGQKGLAFDATVWVRLSRDADPIIVGARSVHAGIKPGKDKPRPIETFSLEWLIFDALRCDPRQAHVRDLVTAEEPIDEPPAPTPTPARDEHAYDLWAGDYTRRVAECTDASALRGALWGELVSRHRGRFISDAERAEFTTLIASRGKALEVEAAHAQAEASQERPARHVRAVS